MKLSKTHLHKIRQLGGFLDRFLELLLKIRLDLIGNVLKPLTKSVLIPLGLTATALETDAAIHKKMFQYGRLSDLATRTIRCIISNEEIHDIMKIFKSLEESDVLIKGVIETIKMKQKNKKEDFLECY